MSMSITASIAQTRCTVKVYDFPCALRQSHFRLASNIMTLLLQILAVLAFLAVWGFIIMGMVMNAQVWWIALHARKVIRSLRA